MLARCQFRFFARSYFLLLLYTSSAPTLCQLLCVRRRLYTHLPVARTFSLATPRALASAHFITSVGTPHLAQGHEKVHECFAHVITSRLLRFSLMFRPSSSAPPTPSVLFPHGPPDWSAVSDTLSDVSRTKIARQAHSDIVRTSLVTWPRTLLSQSDKMVTADNDATPINDLDNDSISDFSKTTHDKAG